VLERSRERMNIDSSSREKQGESSSSGPPNRPEAAISIATLAPRLCPTTAVQPSRAARSLASAAYPSMLGSLDGVVPAKPGRVQATRRTDASPRAPSAGPSSVITSSVITSS
jgi:hypothetical protein